jgi:tetraacyldisaccharide 4'-kinase
MAALERHWSRITPVSLALFPLSLLFCLVVQIRRFLYRHELLRIEQIPVPVIVIGNITVGGTGKTPLVIWLAQILAQAGYRPGIVTRGYRGESPAWPVAVSATTPARIVGDEAVLLARRSSCPVMAGPDRAGSARQLASQGCNVILSDDGLQHYRLARDLEISVIDGARRFGNGLCLPAGPLREPRSRLGSVAFRVTNGAPAGGEIGMQLEMNGFSNLAGATPPVTAKHFSSRVHAVAGIGNPERFFTTLRELGLRIVPHAFPDHYVYRPEDLEFSDDGPVIMTEKDAVKCESFARPNYWALSVSARPAGDLATRILQHLKEKPFGQKTA